MNHRYIQYGLILLLLQSSAVLSQNQSDVLITEAKQQQAKLIDQFGLSKNQWWLDQCHQLIAEMSLFEFKDCIIIDADFPNAYSLAHGSLILTKGLMKNLNNSDQLAHVMAHEHAHLTMNHHQQAMQMVKNPPTFFTKSRLKKFYRQIEQQADIQSDEVLMAHGKDPKQIHHYLLRLENSMDEASNDHEKIQARIQRRDLPKEVIDVQWQQQQPGD